MRRSAVRVQSFAERLADLMGLVEAVAFHKLDRRSPRPCSAAARLGALTHQQRPTRGQRARDRHACAQGLRRRGLVHLGRGSIEIVDAGTLRRVASGTACPQSGLGDFVTDRVPAAS